MRAERRPTPGLRAEPALVAAASAPATAPARPPASADLEARLPALLAADAAGEALALLHAHYARDVRRFIRFLDPAASPDDLCQEVWLAAARALPRFRFDAALRTWLFAIARRRLADRGRRRQRIRRLSSRGLTWERAMLLDGRRPPSTPSSQLRRRRRAAVLEAELTLLETADRELLELRFVEGLMPAAIVDVLGLPDSPNAVSQRLVRLVRKLRQRLLAHDEFRQPA